MTSAGNLDSSAGCLDCAPAAPGAAEEDPTHDTIHKDADFSVRLSKGGAADTDNGLWVETIISAKVTRNEALFSQLPYLPDSTVNEVAGKCREGGSPAAATAASTPTGREGELPFTLQVRGRARCCLTA